ncbi:O-antigen ligase family protein [Aerococcaceae bacterium DSM 111021]|nr:O-antigen ligase family protein [Aerococcaceae bacterium DSM 111021]
MRKYLILIVATVFLGTEILAIPTPVAQITLYRLLVIGMIAILGYQINKQDPNIKIMPNNTATVITAVYLFWWVWGAVSVVWTLDVMNWFQAMFLLTLGISSVVGLYLWTNNLDTWKVLIKTIWIMMTLLALWGLYEIFTNHYIFANLEALDKNNTFTTQPSTRIPITTFANQNDYATLLLAYLPVNLIMLNLSRHSLRRYLYVIPILLTAYLVYRSDSRMILMSFALFFLLVLLLQFRWNIKRKYVVTGIVLMLILVIAVIIFIPTINDTVSHLFYLGGDFYNTGDSRRMNLWRNGLVFLAETFGFGVGAGNIETWMGRVPFLPIDEFTNIHNWWLEILVGYGVLVFVLYVMSYGLLIRSLNRLRHHESKVIRQIAISFIAFLVVYIFASITSANNMLIEWHWVYFGIMISFVKLLEMKDITKPKKNEVLK